jgi:hypothetical protein
VPEENLLGYAARISSENFVISGSKSKALTTEGTEVRRGNTYVACDEQDLGP